MLNYSVTAQPIVEPVPLDLAKRHLRVDFDDDDTLIAAYISAARVMAESRTRRAFFNQTIALKLDLFPIFGSETIAPNVGSAVSWYWRWWEQYAIRLPRPRLQSVTSITYLDTSNTLQTLAPASYAVDAASEPARIVPAPGTFWPYNSQYIPGSITVTYVAGSYGDGIVVNDAPQNLVSWILLMTAHLYQNRSLTSQGQAVAAIPGLDALLDPLRFEWMW